MIDTLVVSDLHLDPSEPHRYEAALSAIAQCSVDRLVLAGDIFEAWVGDDGAEAADLDLLTALGSHAPECWFIPGNRDFLLSESLLQTRSIRWVPSLVLDGVLILHGDELCTDDQAYQTFKAEVRHPNWQRAFLSKPLSERQAIAQGLRNASRETQANRPESIGDAVQATVCECMESADVSALVHGHTHRPGMERLATGLRAVTSDWSDRGVGVWFRSHPDGMREIRSVELTPDRLNWGETWLGYAGTPEWKRKSGS